MARKYMYIVFPLSIVFGDDGYSRSAVPNLTDKKSDRFMAMNPKCFGVVGWDTDINCSTFSFCLLLLF